MVSACRRYAAAWQGLPSWTDAECVLRACTQRPVRLPDAGCGAASRRGAVLPSSFPYRPDRARHERFLIWRLCALAVRIIDANQRSSDKPRPLDHAGPEGPRPGYSERGWPTWSAVRATASRECFLRRRGSHRHVTGELDAAPAPGLAGRLTNVAKAHPERLVLDRPVVFVDEELIRLGLLLIPTRSRTHSCRRPGTSCAPITMLLP